MSLEMKRNDFTRNSAERKSHVVWYARGGHIGSQGVRVGWAWSRAWGWKWSGDEVGSEVWDRKEAQSIPESVT